MTETKIRERLAEFCKTGDLKKVKAIYTMVEDDIMEAEEWSESFIKELDRRTNSFLDGSAKTYSLEEAKRMAREQVKQKA
jgi:hypothetical protein